jgi:hypothetical protein
VLALCEYTRAGESFVEIFNCYLGRFLGCMWGLPLDGCCVVWFWDVICLIGFVPWIWWLLTFRWFVDRFGLFVLLLVWFVCFVSFVACLFVFLMTM